MIQRMQPGMGQGHPVADPGRPEAFAFLKRIQRLAGIQPVKLGAHLGDILEQPLLGTGLRIGANGAGFDDRAKLHSHMISHYPGPHRRSGMATAISGD